MSLPVNPYIAGAPLRGERGFFGRQDTLAWVQRELRNLQTNALVLFGQRRIGKTTLLLQLARNLPSDEFIAIYFDLQDQAARPLGETLSDVADILCEKAGLDLGELGPFDDQGRYFQKEFLPRFYQAVGETRRPVFLLDEFDVLDQSAEAALSETATAKALFPLLRRLMTTDGRSAFVFVVGRRAEDLSIDFSATFKASLVREVWVLDDQSAEALVRQAEANGTLKFTAEAVRRVSSLTNYHPYLTQLLCQRIWELGYADSPASVPLIDGPQVDIALESSLEAGNQALDWLWNGLNPAEKIYASALAEIAGENETIPEERIIEVLATHAARLRTREIELAPRDLVKRHVLDVSPERGGYRFAVELFRRWVHKNKPLTVVKDEVDRIDPMADRLFVFGDGFYDARNWEKAAYYFREALEVNPRHFRARLYLGETLLEQGKVDDAIAELDQALILDREETRLPLARAWLAKAEQLKAEDDLDELMKAYERVLELSPRESLALQGRSAVWVRRAQESETAGDLEAAIEAYRQAGDAENVDRLERVLRQRLLTKLRSEALDHERDGAWEAAVQVYSRMLELAPDDESRRTSQTDLERARAQAAEQMAQEQAQAFERLKAEAQDHEQRGEWDGAVRVYERLSQIEGEETWRDPLDKARQEGELAAIFDEGRAALRNEDWKDAQTLFARLIQARPDYSRDGAYAAALLQDAIQHRKGFANRLPPSLGNLYQKLSGSRKLVVRFLAGALGLLLLYGAITGGFRLYDYYQPDLSVGDVKSAIPLPEEAITGASLEALTPADTWYFPASVTDIALSPDSRTVAVAFHSVGKALEYYTAIFDLETGTVRQIFEGHSGEIAGLAFSPDGGLLATGSHDNTIRLWDLAGGGLVRSLEGHSDYVRDVAFSPDGSLLASASDDRTVRIWQVGDGSLVWTLEGPTDYVRSVAFSPDGSLVAGGDDDGGVSVWHMEDGDLHFSLEGHTQPVRSVAFSPDGSLLAGGSDDGTVIFWRVEDGGQVRTLATGTGSVFDLDFSPDGSLLAVASGDTSGIWDVAGGELLVPGDRYLYHGDFSPDGRFLAAAESGGVGFLTIDPAKAASQPMPTGVPTEAAAQAPVAGEVDCKDAQQGDEVTLLFQWPGVEEILSRILQPVVDACGIVLRPESTNDWALLEERLAAGVPPDLVYTYEGHLVQYQEWLIPMDELGADRANYADFFVNSGTINDRWLGLPVQVYVKTIIWYSPTNFEAMGYEVPTTWDELDALVEQMVADGQVPWSMGFESGDATGWTGTDFIQDILLVQQGTEYVNGILDGSIPYDDPGVRQAYETYGWWATDPAYTVGGAHGTLSTGFMEAIYQPFVDPPEAMMVRQAQFAGAEIAQVSTDYDFFVVPGAQGLQGSVDWLMVFNDTPAVQAIVTYLASRQGGASWAAAGFGLSPNLGAAGHYTTPDLQKLDEALSTTEGFTPDIGDKIPGGFGSAEIEGVAEFVNGGDLDSILSYLADIQAEALNQQ